jgi:cell division protein FtsB
MRVQVVTQDAVVIGKKDAMTKNGMNSFTFVGKKPARFQVLGNNLNINGEEYKFERTTTAKYRFAVRTVALVLSVATLGTFFFFNIRNTRTSLITGLKNRDIKMFYADPKMREANKKALNETVEAANRTIEEKEAQILFNDETSVELLVKKEDELSAAQAKIAELEEHSEIQSAASVDLLSEKDSVIETLLSELEKTRAVVAADPRLVTLMSKTKEIDAQYSELRLKDTEIKQKDAQLRAFKKENAELKTKNGSNEEQIKKDDDLRKAYVNLIRDLRADLDSQKADSEKLKAERDALQSQINALNSGKTEQVD